MSEAKHTPGPWRLTSNRIIVAGEHRVATVLDVYGASKDAAFRPPQGSPEANARLIAAAPEMLAEHEETAKRLRDLADSLAGHEMPDVVQALQGRADSIDAITAKAEGRTE